MSFFDEVDDAPRTEPRRSTRGAPRSAPPRRRSSGGGGRRPPSQHQQSVQTRRAVAVVALVIVVILIAVGVHSCQASANRSALRDYSNSVSSLIGRSNATGTALFKTLSNGGGSSQAINLTNQINEDRQTASGILASARSLSVPDSARTANGHFLLALRMRVDGIADIARNIQSAVNGQASTDAVNAIAAQMAKFYASDVLYKSYTLPELVSALHANGINVSDASINGNQFVTSVEWLQPGFIASALHVSTGGTSSGRPAPGLHGHSLDSVAVGNTTLQTGSNNTVSAKPAPTFTLNFTNGGTNNEQNVSCKVVVNGLGISGQTTVPTTQAGQHATCQVQLKSSPPAGTYTVVASIGKVAGEKNLSNNSQSYTVTFG